MYRLLIVDNEPLIVESIVDLFERTSVSELEVHCAYSSVEALKCLEKLKFDIVLSDIRMPGMSGIELHHEIIKYWPWCKVIFLTGYNDFEYIHMAIRNGSVDYLLKTEGSDAIVEAVRKAMSSLSDALAVEQFISKSKQQMQMVTPFLQKELLWELLQGDAHAYRSMQRSFEEVYMELRPSEPVVAMIGRVDNWNESVSSFDKSLYLFAIQNIAKEYLSSTVQLFSFDFEKKTKIIWLIQPSVSETGLSSDELSMVRQRTLVFSKGAAEMIQGACKNLLKLSLSLAVGTTFKEWGHISEQFEHLQMLLNRGLGLGQELMLLEQNMGALPEAYVEHERRKQLKKLNVLHSVLDNGQKDQFMDEFTSVVNAVSEAAPQLNSIRAEIYFTLVSIFLSYINRLEIQSEIGIEINLGRLTTLDYQNNWKEVVDYFYKLAEVLFEHKLTGQDSQEHDVIRKIQRYVQHNLSGDLTLNRIGEIVGHNPSYLSRLYKQITNEGLSDYIMSARLQKAKELLEENRLKIHEVSIAVGFLSDQSFYRFFRKATNKTPQEYRESVAMLRNATIK